MDNNLSTGTKMPSQEHLNFIQKLNDAKIPRQSQLIANRLFLKNFPRETTSSEIEQFFQSFGAVHDVKIIAKENTHFAFISFVNDNTALEVLRQHTNSPLTFQNRTMILAPAYKKNSVTSLTSPSSYCSVGGLVITPPSTPSRSTTNTMMQHQQQQPSTPYQQQQSLSASHPVYPPLFFPVQTNMPFVPMTGTYIISPGPTATHHPQLPTSFYPTFYTQGTPQSNGHLMNGHPYLPSPYLYPMGPPSTTNPNDVSMNNDC